MPRPDVSTARSHATLTDEQFAAVCELVYDLAGLRFGSSKRYFVDKRVDRCVAEAGVGSFDVWLTRLRRRDGQDLRQALLNDLTVNETYFMREAHQFESMVEDVLPVWLLQRPRRALRIWSLPCATGEEPYSLAIHLLDHWPALDEVDVEIVASDINTEVLGVARRGIYGPRSLKRLTPDQRARYFDDLGSGRLQIDGSLRSAIQFTQANLSDGRAVAAMGPFDVIFCRNLLIYFDAPARAAAMQHMAAAMAPGGHLYLGHSESLRGVSDALQPVTYAKSTAYRKPLDADERPRRALAVVPTREDRR